MEPSASSGMKSQFDWELDAKRAKFRTLKNLSQPSKMARKTLNSKDLQDTVLVFLVVPEHLQKLASDPTAATKYVKEQKFNQVVNVKI